MEIYQPRSFIKLVLIGFSFVALPLILALVNAGMHVNQLAEQNQRAVYQAVQITQYGRLLGEQLIIMERNAKQFQVLRDPALFKNYADTHERFHATIARLAALPPDFGQAAPLRELVSREQTLFETLRRHPPGSPQGREAVLEFAGLNQLAHAILWEGNRLINQEVAVLQRKARKAQQILMWQALALIPVAVLLMVVFTVLIARPIRQIDQAIRQLGEGDFNRDIHVQGPRDLRYLGSRLDWLRRRLAELEEEKTKFLQHVSHELKTPLSAIREGSELLMEEVMGQLNREQREIARIVRHNSMRLQKLIEDLLNFSTERTRHYVRIKRLRLDKLLERVIRDHTPTLLKKQLHIARDYAPVYVLGDEQKLSTIVDNLLSNAIKYSPRGGEITLALRGTREGAVLDVIDTGPGVDPSEKERIFEAFYQGRIALQGHIQGSGLGLAIAREYAQAHDGSIEVVERTRGAHFRVRLRPQKEWAHAS